MPALFIFLLKVNAALLLFCAGYYFVLRHLTFYTLNRIYLVAAIVFASIYPKINLSGFAQQHQALARPMQVIVFNWQAPAETFIKPLSQPNYWYWVELTFWAGAALLAGRLLMQLFSLYKLYRNSKPSRIYGHDVRVLDGGGGPFSFWKSIYVNPANHGAADLKAILLHEQVHVNEWHTLDVLLAELSTIFYWFNPGVWLMKKAIRENIEFITDQKILKKGVDSKQYQYSLVSVSFAASSNTIVNHFNISTIKKRIIMMNAKRSSKFKLTRYAFLVPAVVVLLLIFSISKAALVNKTAVTYKAIVTAIRKGGLTGDERMNATSQSDKKNIRNQPMVLAGNLLKQLPAITPDKLADTIKKGDVYISTNQRTDSLNYVINGVKSTKADFKALDPDKIYSVEFMSGEQAGKVMDHLDNGHSTLFVTTDDSETGKRFKRKIDEVNSNVYMLSGKRMAYYGGDNVTVTGNNMAIAGGRGAVRLNTAPGAYTIAKGDKLYTVRGSGNVWNDSLSKAPMVVGYSISPDSAEGYTVIGKGFSTNKPITIKGKTTLAMAYGAKTLKPGHFKTYTSSWSNDEETNISHLSSKLIMIDGKQATEKALKKLSAADIESMTVKTGDEVTEKYGDKAKDGVLFIITKKSSK